MANIRQRRTSLKDLARELGVSIATVSRALRSSPEIGKDMQQRVKDLAKKLNYRPNPFAQSLRKEAPKVIGVVVPNLVTHYYAAVLDGIEAEARRSGYSVISANSHENFEDEAMAVDNFIGLHVEGIIACLAQNTKDYQHYEELSDILYKNHIKELCPDGEPDKETAKKAQKSAIEDARYVLPNACETKLVMTMNARSLQNFFRLRCCGRAQWEIRELAWQMLALCREAAPSLFARSGPACLNGPCSEGKMSCGMAAEMRERSKSVG